MGVLTGADFFQGRLTKAQYERLPEKLRKYTLVDGKFLTAPSTAPAQWDAFLTQLTNAGWRVFVRDVDVPTEASWTDYLSSGQYMPFSLLMYKEGTDTDAAILAVDSAAKSVDLTAAEAAQAYQNTFRTQVIQPTLKDTKKVVSQTAGFVEKVLPWVALTAGAVAVVYVASALKPLIPGE